MRMGVWKGDCVRMEESRATEQSDHPIAHYSLTVLSSVLHLPTPIPRRTCELWLGEAMPDRRQCRERSERSIRENDDEGDEANETLWRCLCGSITWRMSVSLMAGRKGLGIPCIICSDIEGLEGAGGGE